MSLAKLWFCTGLLTSPKVWFYVWLLISLEWIISLFFYWIMYANYDSTIPVIYFFVKYCFFFRAVAWNRGIPGEGSSQRKASAGYWEETTFLYWTARSDQNAAISSTGKKPQAGRLVNCLSRMLYGPRHSTRENNYHHMVIDALDRLSVEFRLNLKMIVTFWQVNLVSSLRNIR